MDIHQNRPKALKLADAGWYAIDPRFGASLAADFASDQQRVFVKRAIMLIEPRRHLGIIRDIKFPKYRRLITAMTHHAAVSPLTSTQR